jgi:hypothetical protein
MSLSVVEGSIYLGDVCQICALRKNQFALQRICLSCWESMSNG